MRRIKEIKRWNKKNRNNNQHIKKHYHSKNSQQYQYNYHKTAPQNHNIQLHQPPHQQQTIKHHPSCTNYFYVEPYQHDQHEQFLMNKKYQNYQNWAKHNPKSYQSQNHY